MKRWLVVACMLLCLIVVGCTLDQVKRAERATEKAEGTVSTAKMVVDGVTKTIPVAAPITAPISVVLGLVGAGLFALKKVLKSKREQMESGESKEVIELADEERRNGSTVLALLSSRKFTAAMVAIIGAVALAVWKIDLDKEVVMRFVSMITTLAIVLMGGTALEDAAEKYSNGN